METIVIVILILAIVVAAGFSWGFVRKLKASIRQEAHEEERESAEKVRRLSAHLLSKKQELATLLAEQPTPKAISADVVTAIRYLELLCKLLEIERINNEAFRLYLIERGYLNTQTTREWEAFCAQVQVTHDTIISRVKELEHRGAQHA